ncbi:MAG: hypothetical protein ACE5H0_00725 [Bacteroidota bacterium]
MRNGYQLPGEEDGDDLGKEPISPHLVIDQLGNFLGVRLNYTPLEVKTNARVENGEPKTSFDLGKPIWVQVFTAGSIYKNVGVFIETEFNTAKKEVKNSWFRLGFHNLFGPAGAANVRVGQLSPMDWHAISGRLRMISNVKIQGISFVKSSNGKGEDSAVLASAYPGLEFYGYQGPVLYSVGVVNGPKLADPNTDKNVFGTLRLEHTSGDFEGSAITFWAVRGVDTKETATAQKRNVYWRVSPALNVRHESVDFIAGFFYGQDDNWTLAGANNEQKNTFRSGVVQLGYTFTPQIYGVLQYDRVDSHLNPESLDFNKLTGSLSYFPRGNMRVALSGRIDLQDTDPAVHPDKLHEITVTLRTMF